MVFLKINNTDLTDYCFYQDAAFNQAPVYESWMDGNYIEHRDIVRRRITGTVKAGFQTAASLAILTNLLDTIQSNAGYCSVTAYVHNMGAEVTFNAYVTTDASSKWDLVNSRQFHEITISVTER